MLKKNVSRKDFGKVDYNNKTTPIENKRINYYYIFNPRFRGFNVDNFKQFALSKNSSRRSCSNEVKPQSSIRKFLITNVIK